MLHQVREESVNVREMGMRVACYHYLRKIDVPGGMYKEFSTVSKKVGKREQILVCCLCFLTLDSLEIPFYTRAKDHHPEPGGNV
jgi:hypothetical protein